jgi:hypothetical protein
MSNMSNRCGVLSLVLMFGLSAAAQDPSPKPTLPKPSTDAQSTQTAPQLKFQRLILKDGSYQLVSKYQRIGDRVRYTSAERGDAVEEVPAVLVDFAATEKWAKEHAPGAPRNPGLDEAAKVDAEEAAERAEEAARQPEVEPGLKLPDNDGVWGLDIYRGTPELFEVLQNAGAVNSNRAHNILKASINPLGGSKQTILLEGARAKVNFHVNEPALYIALNVADDKSRESDPGAFKVETQGGEAKPPKNGSPASRYVIVRVEEKKTTRLVAAFKVSMLGQVSQQEDIVDATTAVLPGGHWMKVTPKRPLEIGQYALVEIVSPKVVNLDVWDFGIDPQAKDNAGSLTPIAQQKRKPVLR